ncbi:autotransporter outer membrane beta-barrel domain-containing protein [Maricaulis maris]|nr:autotransporter outer membrane beta-barrel domain-containing protein [Maricaulis maris]
MQSRRISSLLLGTSPHAMSIALAGASLAAIVSPAAWAVDVGDTVTNPITGGTETVQAVLGDNVVMTDAFNVIIVATAVGETIVDPTATADTPGSAATYTITSINIDPFAAIVSYTAEDGDGNSFTFSSVTSRSGDITTASSGVTGSPGSPATTVNPAIPAGNINVFSDRQTGSNGADGDNAWGARICIIKCFTIGENGDPGEDGGPGPDVIHTLTTSGFGDIESITDNLPGISVVSIGGDGGDGGDSVGFGFQGYEGGASGAGGVVQLTSHVDVSTSGEAGHGIFALSRAGSGGDGGSGFIWSDGGSSGPAAEGGTVTVVNHGAISTTGLSANGILAQSMGGASGDAGSSFGIVGDADSGSTGGNGSTVTVTNYGSIITTGTYSDGIVAQSIGGSGGDAGASGGLVAFGGGGGGAGNGGLVVVTNAATGTITTRGDDAVGITAQSIGGGGGRSGASAGIAALGAGSGSGGDASTVTVYNDGAISTGTTTTGDRSHGIMAQSIGGGGGSGRGTGGLVALGGTGGSGGAAGEVRVDNDGLITTTGEGALGILVQSIGGGGGNGSSTVGLAAIGGDGDAGGSAETVTVSGTGTISTTGMDAHGVLAQAIGGGGGNGGTSGGIVGIGGDGDVGGDGGVVDITMGSVLTEGDRAFGILAQSIGGGGGNGGAGGGIGAIGGDGSGGGTGNTVTVTTSGLIQTQGNGATGIVAQSIGGGGGNGGGAGGMVSVGGQGGTGNSASTVTVNANGNILTTNENSNGIIAQSIGGGGGNGGSAVSGGLFASVAVGGDGAVGGEGGTVRVNTADGAFIETREHGSTGIVGQSVGGGGGNGGYSVAGSIGAFGSVSVAVGGNAGAGGRGGVVEMDLDGSVLTFGDNAHAVLAQSVGGGGGNGGQSFAGAVSAGVGASASVSVAVGGDGGAGGDSDSVTVRTADTIQTSGDNSFGVLAQSVGGGGGNGGWTGTANLAISTGAAVSLGVSMGGSGGAGGFGSTVLIDATGNVITAGSNAHGLVAQSIGGGGGNGGFSFSGSLSAGGIAGVGVDVALGGDGGAGSYSGQVTLNSDGVVATSGDNSHGLFAQSVGGGGGNGGWSATGSLSVGGTAGVGIGVSLGGDGGSGGVVNGDVVVTSDGTVFTFGNVSHGILAQSIGGGGGNGGFAFSGSLALGGTAGGAVNVALGGAAGDGAHADDVTVASTAVVETTGAGSHGIAAQSIGGGGGNGGWSATGNIAAGGTAGVGVGVSIGGGGGAGSYARSVTVTQTDHIITRGTDAHGVLAQSIGGGGGNGGFSVAAGAAGGMSVGGAVNVSLGGSGGVGGAASTVNVTVEDVATGGDGAIGVLAQSIGGGGGNGGFAIAASLVGGGSVGGAVNVGIGGSGGSGGSAGDVTVTAQEIATLGDGAHGISAQSLGGGGGNGGFSVTGGLSFGTQAAAVGVSLGGGGGTGNTAGVVTVNATDQITTEGDNANGILAQSIGGGGGNGGAAISGTITAGSSNAAGINVAIGGNGGSGGTGGAVNVNTLETIYTLGDQSNGIFAQSVGGGGGNGGLSITGGISLASSNSAAIGVSLGGSGGSGNTGGAVTVDSRGQVGTEGDQSAGIFAQSVGGGGGNGGFSGAFGATGGGNSAAINVALGGDGGSGGVAGAVDVTVSGNVQTLGDQSSAVHAQSIGGGGGNGGASFAASVALGDRAGGVAVSLGGSGDSGGNASTADVLNSAVLASFGDNSHGILAQSVGGGGGNGGWAASLAGGFGNSSAGLGVSLGGSGGVGGTGEGVQVTNNGQITTAGDNSVGILAQSVGGGGGNGGFAVSGALTAGDRSVSIGVSLGGSGGTGGTAGTVDVTNTASIGTAGDMSSAILAQSVGGGGGNGGWTGSMSGTVGNNRAMGISFGLGGSGGTGGAAGDVIVDTSGSLLMTEGDRAHGVFAQSVGGGGGNGGMALTATFGASDSVNVAASIGGTGGEGGTAGTVDVTSSSIIQTAGYRAHGIYAESVGGGGGTGGSSGSLAAGGSDSVNLSFAVGGTGGTGNTGNTVTVNNSGSITAWGEASHAIFAQSVGGGGGDGGFAGLDSSAFGTQIIGDQCLPESETPCAPTGGGGAGAGGIGSNTFNLATSVGGFGGTGGHGGDVFVTNSGTLVTVNKDAHVVFAQSVGGGGGNGGPSMSATGAAGASESASIAITVGGSGGAAGNGGDVSVDNEGTIISWVRGSNGVFAQSIGGGGGNGGSATGFAITRDASSVNDDTKNLELVAVVGGFGGAAGNGGDVTVANSGAITTFGAGSDGIKAQSVGGGGGNGGGTSLDGEELDALLSSSDNDSLSFTLGGFGGASGDGGDVRVTNSGSINTWGDGARGIFAQSVGGGGGEVGMGGATATGTIAIGGFGGAAGDGGDVTVINTGSIQTSGTRFFSADDDPNYGEDGDLAYGIFAQSIGGGGGNGGAGNMDGSRDTRNAVIENNGDLGSTFQPDISIGMGGFGGASGDGGNVVVTNSGSIVTTGDNAHAILAQSIGGGGGNAGDGYISNAGAISFGGIGGNAGDGGDVTVTHTGDITTHGIGAYGIFAQSIGGGGGNAGDTTVGVQEAGVDVARNPIGGNSGDGGDVTINSSGTINLLGGGAIGIFAQSIGGGGGTFGSANGLGFFGAMGGEGEAGRVIVNHTGAIISSGRNAIAFFAQSLGTTFAPAEPIAAIAPDQAEAQAGVHVVAAATEAAETRSVMPSFTDRFGPAGLAEFVDPESRADAVDVMSALAAAAITVTLDNDIRGGSDRGIGVFFDGGADNTLFTSGSVSAVSGNAIVTTTGNDLIENTGLVVGNVDLGSGVNRFDNQAGATFIAFDTIDLRDDAVSPQTVLGQGNSVSVDAAAAGAVSQSEPVATGVTEATTKRPVQADLVAHPQTTPAPLSPMAGNGDASVGVKGAPVQEALSGPIPEGDLQAGLADGKPTVQVMAELDRDMTGAELAGEPVTPVAAPSPVGAATFRNAGNFIMGLSASTYPIDLLNGDTFGNFDAVGDPTTNLLYGARVINTVELDGHFEQTDSGHLVFDVAYGPYASDRVNVTGGATVAGTGDVTLTWLQDREAVTLFATADGAVDNGLSIRDTLAVDFSIAADAAGIHLLIDTDFGLASLNRNGRALGAHMDSALDVGGSAGIGRLLAFLGNMQSDQLDLYEAVFAELNPEPHLAVMHGQLSSANDFADDLFNCGSPIGRRDDQCAWSRLEMTASARDAGFENLHTESESMRFTGGFEQRVGDDWSVAAGVSYAQTDPIRIDGHRARTESSGFVVGLGAERNPATGPYYGASVSGGWSWHETERAVEVFTTGIGTSSPETGHARLDGHVGESFRHGSLFARPQVSASLTALYHDGLTEEGLDGLGIEVRADKELIGAINPQLTVGHIFRETEGMVGVVSLTGGLRLSTQDRLELPMRFLGSNPLAEPAMIGTSLDQLVYQIGADIEIAGNERVGLSIGYDAEFGAETEHQRAGIDFRVRF